MTDARPLGPIGQMSLRVRDMATAVTGRAFFQALDGKMLALMSQFQPSSPPHCWSAADGPARRSPPAALKQQRPRAL